MALRRPRIKRTTESFRSPEGDYYLRRPSAGQDVKIEQPDAKELRLVDALDGTRTLEELHEEFGAEAVDDAVSQMQELEVIEDAGHLCNIEQHTRFNETVLAFLDRH